MIGCATLTILYILQLRPVTGLSSMMSTPSGFSIGFAPEGARGAKRWDSDPPPAAREKLCSAEVAQSRGRLYVCPFHHQLLPAFPRFLPSLAMDSVDS
jgi:hypothetical protein